MRSVASAKVVSQEAFAQKRFQLSFGLTAAIWIAGLVGHFTPLAEWPALFIYVVGSIGLTLWHCNQNNDWQATYVTNMNLQETLKWGGLIGGGLFLMDVGMAYKHYADGGAPMNQMQGILLDMNLLYLFPILILAEEFLWRGLMFSALIDRGMNKHAVVAITTLFYMLNHFAVAPVGMMERGMMAGMALPIGVVGGYIVAKTRNVWGSVALHMITMLSMVVDMLVIPRLF
ncbi:MAG: CPBP family intramembrane metalloprotease [Chlorobiales bacterium]|jgi:uncharacterized protein|nr:CPBP family intramembrane metalloprotease [Chlorobiales bacterium]